MSVRPLSVVGSARPFRPKRGRRPMKRGRTALKTEVAKPASLAIMTRTGADLRACERQISPRSFLSFLFCFRRESRSSRAAGGRRLHRPRDRRASSTSRFQSTRNAPPKRGISVVMESASRSLNLSSVKDADPWSDRSIFRASRTQTVSPWSRRALEVDICQSEPCRPATCQPEEAPEAAAPCEAGRQRRQRSASPRMQPAQLESSA